MKNNGFSLVELLVTVFIVALLSSIAIVNFGDIKEQLALKRAAHQLIQDLRRAQEMAVSPRKSGKCSPLLLEKGYGIYIDIPADNKGYKLYADTADDGSSSFEWGYYTPADCVIETIYIQEKGVIIQQITNTDGGVKVSVNFTSPNPTTKIKWIADGMDEVEIVLALEAKPSKTKTVVVNKAGMIAIDI